MAGVGKGVAAAMPQHARMYGEIEAGTSADALDQSIGGIRCERGAALGRKDVARIRELPAKLAQCPDLVPSERMNARLPVLGAPDMQ